VYYRTLSNKPLIFRPTQLFIFIEEQESTIRLSIPRFEKQKRLLVSSCLSVRLSKWNNSAPTGGIFMKLHIRAFFENMSRKFKIFKISQK